jgi:serine/threonine protein kinase/Leucine-rich repeat (LRR) protein
MIAFPCTACHTKLTVKDDLAGKRVRCPSCGAIVAVPASSAQPSRSVSTAKQPLQAPPGSEQITQPPAASAEATAPPSPSAGHDGSLTDFLAPPQADDELGRLGGYRILQVLGHGGMGVVFLADEPALGRKVAIKVMRPAASAAARQRFLREARVAAALDHDHVIAVHHVGQEQGTPFIVMPLLKGESLDARLRREEALPVADIVRIGRQTANGLACAHAAGLIHRDIKPGNLWLEGKDEGGKMKDENAGASGSSFILHPSSLRVKIFDFGLARSVDDDAQLTQSGDFVGTPAYTAPEQANGQPVDARADLFSLGCVLYRLCTGRPPFKGKDTLGTLLAVANETPTPVRQINPAIPESLAALVMALLAKEPSARPASAQRVADILAALEQEAIASAGAEQTPSPSPPPPDHRASAATTRTILLVLAGIGALAAGGGLLLVVAVALTLLLTRGGDESEKRTAMPGPAPVVPKPNEERDRRSDDKQDLNAGAKEKEKEKEKEKIVAVAHDDRVVAEWVLKSPRGLVTYRAGERMPQATATKPEQLPKGPIQLVELRIEGAIADDDLKRLAGLTALRRVYFGPGITNAGMSYLANLPALEMLDLGSPLVTDDGLAHLQKLPALHTLNLLSTRGITGAGFIHLQKLPQFKHLSVAMLQPAKDAMRHIKGIPALDSLALWNIPVTDAALVDLEGSTINRLILSQTTKITPKGLASVRQLPRLRNLQIGGVPMPDDAVQPIGELTNLTHLYLESMKLGDSALGRLERLRQLEVLSIVGNPISDRGLAHLRGMTHLQNLHLTGTQVTDEGLIHLQGLKKLKSLQVMGTKVTARGVEELRKSLPGVAVTGALPVGDDRAVAKWAVAKGIIVNYCLARDANVQGWARKAADLPAEPFYVTFAHCNGPFTDDDLKRFVALLRLTGLVIMHSAMDNQRVTDAGLAYLKLAPALKDLQLHFARVTDDGLAHLEHVPMLETLHLTSINITGAGLKHLQQLPKLKYLGLSGIFLSDSALEFVRGMRALQHFSVTGISDAGLAHLRGMSLTRLEVASSQNLTDKGIATLLEMPKLTWLDLRELALSDSAMKTIGRMTKLTTLNLSQVEFADEHLAHLKNLTELTVLGLFGTPTSDDSLAHFEGMTKLASLHLFNTRVTDKGLVHLQKLQNLRALNLGETKVTPEGRQALKKHLPLLQ